MNHCPLEGKQDAEDKSRKEHLFRGENNVLVWFVRERHGRQQSRHMSLIPQNS